MPSQLEEYTRNYGSRLQSLLVPGASAVTDTSSVLGRPRTQPQPAPQSAMQPAGVQPSGAVTSPVPDSALQDPQQQKGSGVKDVFAEMTPEQQDKQLKALKAALERGNSSIDKAYDELEKQMGTRPEEGLTEKDKGLLLMEFGLNLMANSNKGPGEAAGAAGLNYMDSAQRASTARRRGYDARRSSLEDSRAKDKLDLATDAAKAEVKSALAPEKEFAPKVPHVFAGGDGFMYQTDEYGNTSKMKDESGNPIKATEKDVKGAGSEKSFEFDHRYNRYLEIHGKDPSGNPLTGAALEKVKKRALEFAADQKNATLSEAEIRTVATRAVDDHMRYFADTFRDYKPAELEKYRKDLVEQRVKEMRNGMNEDAEFAPPPPAAGGSALGPLRSPSSALEGGSSILNRLRTPPAEALVAGKARKIKGFDGRWTLVNGKPTRVD